MTDDNTWPGGKRVAVLVSILFEVWADGKWPSYFPRTSPQRHSARACRGGVKRCPWQ
jgi:hypothetical protein